MAALAQEHGVEELVLGHPINMDGTRGPRSEKAQAMKVLLEETSSLPVILWDERRTTIDAHQILLNNGKNAKKRKKVVDAVAASLILEAISPIKKAILPGNLPPAALMEIDSGAVYRAPFLTTSVGAAC